MCGDAVSEAGAVDSSARYVQRESGNRGTSTLNTRVDWPILRVHERRC